MIKVVIDTNVLVSALLSPNSNPAKVLALVVNERVVTCYDSRMMLEYESVLLRKKFPFNPQDVSALLGTILQTGTAVVPEPSKTAFTDESDIKFYEVAKATGAYLITGNIKHFPDEPCIVQPTAFLQIVAAPPICP
jgi:putative PIN family toxin of toxin-antitoxin system